MLERVNESISSLPTDYLYFPAGEYSLWNRDSLRLGGNEKLRVNVCLDLPRIHRLIVAVLIGASWFVLRPGIY